MTTGLTGSLDEMFLQAISDAEDFCPAQTGPESANNTPQSSDGRQLREIFVANAIGVYIGDVVLLGDEVQEVIGVDPDATGFGIFPGTIYLAGNLVNTYAVNSTAQFYRQSFYTVRGHATDPLDRAVALASRGAVGGCPCSTSRRDG